MKRTTGSGLRAMVNRSIVGLAALAALVIGAPAAHAYHRHDEQPLKATSWSLVRILPGDVSPSDMGLLTRAQNILVEDVKPTSQGGELHLRIRVNGSDTGMCPNGFNRFRLSWDFAGDITRLVKGDEIHVSLRNESLGPDTCDPTFGRIDPSIQATGNEGSPARIVANLTTGDLTNEGTKEVIGVGSTQGTIVVPNWGSLDAVHRGYFTIRITAPWHFQYEIVYLYEADVEGNRPPTAPTPLSPPNDSSWRLPALASPAITFQWDYDDPDGDPVRFGLQIFKYNSGRWEQAFYQYVDGNPVELRIFEPWGYYAWRVVAVETKSDPLYTFSEWSFFRTR